MTQQNLKDPDIWLNPKWTGPKPKIDVISQDDLCRYEIIWKDKVIGSGLASVYRKCLAVAERNRRTLMSRILKGEFGGPVDHNAQKSLTGKNNGDLQKVSIYIDGACSGYPGIGAWAAILVSREFTKTITGIETQSTSNRMKLRAVAKAVQALKMPCEITFYTYSRHVIGWLYGWNIRTKQPDPTKKFRIKDAAIKRSVGQIRDAMSTGMHRFGFPDIIDETGRRYIEEANQYVYLHIARAMVYKKYDGVRLIQRLVTLADQDESVNPLIKTEDRAEVVEVVNG